MYLIYCNYIDRSNESEEALFIINIRQQKKKGKKKVRYGQFSS